MYTIRTFTAYSIFDSDVNITVELRKCENFYEVVETHSVNCTCDKSFSTTRHFPTYREAKCDFDNTVHIIIDFA